MKKELYRFVEGVNVWTVTSADSEETHNTELYTPATVGRNNIESKNELSKANIQVSFDIDSPIARRWLNEVVDDVVTLSIFSKEDGLVEIIWKGRLMSVHPGTTDIKLLFESVFTSLRLTGIRKRYQRSCPYILYGRGCSLDKANFEEAGTVTAISSNGVTLTVPEAAGFASGFFIAGMIKVADGTFRFITNHSGSTITLIRPVNSLVADFAEFGNTAISLYPGCDRSKEVCNNKFNNLNNYGGFAFIPTKNPFAGGSLL